MEETELTAFESEDGNEERPSNGPLPETPPESLLDGFVPPIKERTPIAPDHPTCDVQTGDLLVIEVGDDALEHYGFLILSAYANRLVGINLHNHNYGVRALDDWLDWYDEYREAGDFEAGEKQIYPDVAPVGQQRGVSSPAQTEEIQDAGTVEG
jgi:hypothetical protein